MNKNIIIKVLTSFLLIALLFSLANFSFASNTVNEVLSNSSSIMSRTTLELVEDNTCTINLNDLAEFNKKITSFDAENKSATLTLTLTNLKKAEESQLPVEIFLVIDNSKSMLQTTSEDITRKESVITSANTLVDKLFEANKNAKVGIVSFSSLDSAKQEVEGTINDANLILELSDSITDIKNAINQVSMSETGPRTNIEAGITTASQYYSASENVKRYIVLLTDGVPNNALDGSFATYVGTVANRTKAKLEEIENSGINIIGAMIGLNGETVEAQSKKTYKALAEEVFGTIDDPTISEYYYISDAEIENTILDHIFKSIVSVKNYRLENIVIKDYFPQEIIDNFNFEYVASPNIGEISEKIDTSDNSITWTIASLAEDETATISYKLTLKDDYNKEIIDKILPTNEKVDITAENDGTTIEETSNESPKIRVLYDEPVQEPVDNTIAPDVIPQTGVNDTVVFISSIMIITSVLAIRFYILKKKLKLNNK